MNELLSHYTNSRKEPRSRPHVKSASNIKNGRREGNSVSFRSSHAIIGPSRANEDHHHGTLVRNVGLQNKFATVMSDGKVYSIPTQNLKFNNKELAHGSYVQLTLKGQRSINGEIVKSNRNTLTIKPNNTITRLKRQLNNTVRVNRKDIVSFINYTSQAHMLSKWRNENRLIADHETKFINRLDYSDALRLYKIALQKYYALFEQTYAFEFALQKNNSEHGPSNVLTRYYNIQHKKDYFAAILKRLTLKFPQLVNLIPSVSAHGMLKNNDYLKPYNLRQLKKIISGASNTSHLTSSNDMGSSAKPTQQPISKRMGKTRQPPGNIELHHIISGKIGQPSTFEISRVINLPGRTFWHSNEKWNWKGKDPKERPIARLVGLFDSKNIDSNKLQYTGRHEYTVEGKRKGTFVYREPLKLYVYNIDNNGQKPVYFVRPILESQR